MPDFLSELRWRGLIAQVTNEPDLAKHLATGTRRAYAGFDPTADSLTIGNLVPIMLLAHFQRAGHAPVVVAGGGTGLIGDPSGKSAERTLMTPERVQANVDSQMKIYERVLDFSDTARDGRATIVNNADWLCKLGFVDVLRDVGKHFSVNMMIQKDSVRERLHARDQGISYTEFSYMILQSYDFLHLFKSHGVTLQIGGSDQWGNIVAGIDLIRRVQIVGTPTGLVRGSDDESLAFGLTAPLVTKSDGGKFGKTESGAIWLSADRTSPYNFYQFWLNADDADVIKFLKIFTFQTQDQIAALEDAHSKNPGAREPHRALAREVTKLLHGDTEAANAEAAAKALFSGEIASLPEPMLRDVFANVPSSDHDKAQLGASGGGVAVLELLVTTGLAQSKREAKEFLATGSVTVNGRKVAPDDKLGTTDLLHASLIALRRGKKHWHLTRWK